jgi:hypothetical protein
MLLVRVPPSQPSLRGGRGKTMRSGEVVRPLHQRGKVSCSFPLWGKAGMGALPASQTTMQNQATPKVHARALLKGMTDAEHSCPFPLWGKVGMGALRPR